MPNAQKYDLEERTAVFGETGIKFARKIPQDPITIPLITQFVKSITSVGANYCEADDAESRMDFKHKIGICKKEARETKYWLRMIATAAPQLKEEAKSALAGSKGIIFDAIVKSTKNNKSNN